ncbi:MAG: glycosyltransferase family 4 protein, partial [Bacteroidia bacterium]
MLSHGLKNNYYVIPNVVDTHLFFPSLEVSKKDKFILLHVSNLDDRAKNVSGIIKALKKLSAKRNDFEFHIVGDGENRSVLEAFAEKSSLLNKNIFFLGTKKPLDVAEMMRKADLFLLFSNYDNMPCVMIESFASGLPVIGSAIHGIKEHVKEGRGIVIPPGDENALCEAVDHALNNIHAYDKMKLNTYAKENFSYEAVGEQFDHIYQKVIRK